ncbi:MAG: FUSC family protein [Actinomycetota bacterium]|nr:FUSC family protein [Actinomycetota bacterium]
MALRVTRVAARRVASAASRALRRPAADIWPLLQGTAAATAAWVIARYALDRPEPFFAPIAALVALNKPLGERGLNTLRLLEGVFVGIVVGELALVTLGGGYGSVAVAVFAATALARVLNESRIVIAQGASAAILTVALADAEAGVQRLTDALIGAGVALVFTQLLFSPDPLALLRRSETALLVRMADGLALAARALAEDDDEVAERAVATLRDVPEELVELRRARRASARVARRTLAGRSRRALVVQENENADHLDLLAASCLVLARVAASLNKDERQALARSVRDLASELAALADDLGERETRQRAADRAFDVAIAGAGRDAAPGSALAAGVIAVRGLAIDLMVFAGVDFDNAVDAVREGVLEHRVPAPPPPRRGLVGWLRSRLR